MKTARYDAQDARKLLLERKIATLAELKDALGTPVDLTVLRKLKPLGYLTSYSHSGRFYTLEEIADFDEQGLWSFGQVWFSKHGTLLSTAEHFVSTAETGYFASELASRLSVRVKEALIQLVRRKRIVREKTGGVYLYCSSNPGVRKRQLMRRRLVDTQAGFEEWATRDETKAAIVLFFSALDEQQRRLYAGLESLKLGRGGDRKISQLIGMDVHTVAKGRRALIEQDLDFDRVRNSGGGRKRVEKKHRKSSKPSGN